MYIDPLNSKRHLSSYNLFLSRSAFQVLALGLQNLPEDFTSLDEIFLPSSSATVSLPPWNLNWTSESWWPFLRHHWTLWAHNYWLTILCWDPKAFVEIKCLFCNYCELLRTRDQQTQLARHQLNKRCSRANSISAWATSWWIVDPN